MDNEPEITALQELFTPKNTFVVSNSYAGDMTTNNYSSEYSFEKIMKRLSRSINEEGKNNKNVFGLKEIPAKILADTNNPNYITIITKNGFEIVLCVSGGQIYDGRVMVNEFVKQHR